MRSPARLSLHNPTLPLREPYPDIARLNRSPRSHEFDKHGRPFSVSVLPVGSRLHGTHAMRRTKRGGA